MKFHILKTGCTLYPCLEKKEKLSYRINLKLLILGTVFVDEEKICPQNSQESIIR